MGRRGEDKNMELFAPLVISDAGLLNTFKTLLPPTIADKSCRYKETIGIGHFFVLFDKKLC